MSKGGGGGGGNQTVTQQSAPPAYLMPYLNQADTAAQGIYNNGPPPLYPNQTYAPINSTQQQGLNQTLAYGTQGANPATTAGINTLTDAANSNPDPSQNPYIMNLINQQGLNANQIVAGNFNSGGRYGSGAQAAAAGTAVTNAQLPTLAAQYNTDMSNKLNSAALLPGLANTQNQQQISQAQAVGTVGDAYQSQDQNAINEAIQRYQYANGGGAQQSLQTYINDLAATPNSGSSSTSTKQAPTLGIGGQIGSITSGLGALGGLSGTLGSGLTSLLGATGEAGGTMSTIASLMSMFSDERLKKNIEYVGKENGHNVYEFEYKNGSGQRYRGVMAQEVIKTHPEAVIMDKSGYMAVNYAKIGVNFHEVGAKAPLSAAALASQGGLTEVGAAGSSMGVH